MFVCYRYATLQDDEVFEVLGGDWPTSLSEQNSK